MFDTSADGSGVAVYALAVPGNMLYEDSLEDATQQRDFAVWQRLATESD